MKPFVIIGGVILGTAAITTGIVGVALYAINKSSKCETMVDDEYMNYLELHTPKKPTPENRYYGNGACPNCGAVFMDKLTKFCGNCGQALDWSK